MASTEICAKCGNQVYSDMVHQCITAPTSANWSGFAETLKPASREIHFKTVRDVLDHLLPGDDEDAVFEKQAAEDHIRALIGQEAPASGDLRLRELREKWRSLVPPVLAQGD